MQEFESLLESIAKRPEMWVGECSVRAVRNYLEGYCHASAALCDTETPLDGWGFWLESRFLISHPAWGWTRILLHAYGSDRAAIEAIPQLHREFLAQRAALGVEGIYCERTRRLIAEYGQDWGEPLVTNTTSDV
jgi:hypothetical protein